MRKHAIVVSDMFMAWSIFMTKELSLKLSFQVARNRAQEVSGFWLCFQFDSCFLPDSPKVITAHFFWVPGAIFSALGTLTCLIFRIILEGDVIIIFILLMKKPRFRNVK